MFVNSQAHESEVVAPTLLLAQLVLALHSAAEELYCKNRMPMSQILIWSSGPEQHLQVEPLQCCPAELDLPNVVKVNVEAPAKWAHHTHSRASSCVRWELFHTG